MFASVQHKLTFNQTYVVHHIAVSLDEIDVVRPRCPQLLHSFSDSISVLSLFFFSPSRYQLTSVFKRKLLNQCATFLTHCYNGMEAQLKLAHREFDGRSGAAQSGCMFITLIAGTTSVLPMYNPNDFARCCTLSSGISETFLSR